MEERRTRTAYGKKKKSKFDDSDEEDENYGRRT